MRNVLVFCVGAAALALAPGEAFAWGWTQASGSHYLKVWDRSLLGSRAYFADGVIRPLPTGFGDHGLNYYLEYGITDRWTLVTTGSPLGYSVFSGNSTFYMGSLAAGLRRAITQGTWNVAAEAHYGYAPPLGERALGAGFVDGHSFSYIPAVQTHHLDGELQIGRGIGRGWLSARAGLRWYSREGFDPAIFAGISGGYTFEFGLQLSGSLHTHQPLGEVVFTNVTGVSQTRYVGFAIDASFWFNPHWAVTAGVGGVALAQSNAGTLPFLVGFEHR